MDKAVQTLHANAIVIDGIGVLILGDAGIGKSAVSLRLLQLGHSLVSDDAVTFHQLPQQLEAHDSPKHRGLLHVYGLGLIDCAQLWPQQHLSHHPLHWAVRLITPDDYSPPNRLQREVSEYQVLNTTLPQITIPHQYATETARNIILLNQLYAQQQLGQTWTDTYLGAQYDHTDHHLSE